VEKLINVAVNVLFTTLVGIVFVTIYAFTVHWIIAPVYFLTVPCWLAQLDPLPPHQGGAEGHRGRDHRPGGATTESLRNIELVKSLGLASQEVARSTAPPRRSCAWS